MKMPSEEFDQVRSRVNAWSFWTEIYLVPGARANIGYTQYAESEPKNLCIYPARTQKKKDL